jgi:hypothetical protein
MAPFIEVLLDDELQIQGTLLHEGHGLHHYWLHLPHNKIFTKIM